MGVTGDRSGGPARVGFACQWDRDRERTWSGSPWALRTALARKVDLTDVDVTLPLALRGTLKLAGARRRDGRWMSMWKHGRLARAAVDRLLARQTARRAIDALVEIQDLGTVPVPFLVVQDLSYGLLLDHYGEDGVPHFRTLGRDRIRALHERQLGVYADAAMLLPMSRWLASHLESSGVPADRIRVVNPGITHPVPLDTPVPDRRVGPERRLLLVGRDFDTKGGHQVVEAVRLLRREHGDRITLTVIGPPVWPLPGGVPSGVHFEGPASASRVAEAMDRHDLLVMPSHLEGFGMVFAEALTRGLPCIGRDACAMPEIIDPTTGGRLVRSESAEDLAALIDETLEDDALYAACAASVPERRRHYSWERAATQVADAVAEVTA